MYRGTVHVPFYRRHVLKTKFYQQTKVALAFRPMLGFLPEAFKPFGMFIVIGNEFRDRRSCSRTRASPRAVPRP